MEKYNISLVVFTWLTQASVGLIFLRAIYMRKSSASDGKIYITGRYILLTAFILLLTGLLFSFAHLNYPGHSYNALNNVSSSWMSREILAEIVFLVIIFSWYIIIGFRITKVPLIIPEVLAVLSGIALIYFMIRTYMLPSLPELNHPSFTLSFIITPLLAGAVIIYLFLKKNEPGLAVKFKMFFTILFIFSLINHIIFISFHRDFTLVSIYTAFYLAGFIFSFPSLNATMKNKNVISDVIFLALALICDFLNRVYALTFTDPAL
ncbi:MAG: DmsC/YnfH family molybdoenzyme membrane anchor subunit [Bacteroidota bacterium]|nr:DmsC/YnfH family molybdoenzyme membrane anchor subunit [Bacteroidota bacterium]